MSRLVDPTICPDCRAALDPGSRCTGCGLHLEGPLAVQLWAAMTAADRVLEQLRAATTPLPAEAAGRSVRAPAAGPATLPALPGLGAPGNRPASTPAAVGLGPRGAAHPRRPVRAGRRCRLRRGHLEPVGADRPDPRPARVHGAARRHRGPAHPQRSARGERDLLAGGGRHAHGRSPGGPVRRAGRAGLAGLARDQRAGGRSLAGAGGRCRRLGTQPARPPCVRRGSGRWARPPPAVPGQRLARREPGDRHDGRDPAAGRPGAAPATSRPVVGVRRCRAGPRVLVPPARPRLGTSAGDEHARGVVVRPPRLATGRRGSPPRRARACSRPACEAAPGRCRGRAAATGGPRQRPVHGGVDDPRPARLVRHRAGPRPDERLRTPDLGPRRSRVDDGRRPRPGVAPGREPLELGGLPRPRRRRPGRQHLAGLRGQRCGVGLRRGSLRGRRSDGRSAATRPSSPARARPRRLPGPHAGRARPRRRGRRLRARAGPVGRRAGSRTRDCRGGRCRLGGAGSGRPGRRRQHGHRLPRGADAVDSLSRAPALGVLGDGPGTRAADGVRSS